MKAAIATATLLFVGAASEYSNVQCVRLSMDQRIFVHVPGTNMDGHIETVFISL